MFSFFRYQVWRTLYTFVLLSSSIKPFLVIIDGFSFVLVVLVSTSGVSEWVRVNEINREKVWLLQNQCYAMSFYLWEYSLWDINNLLIRNWLHTSQKIQKAFSIRSGISTISIERPSKTDIEWWKYRSKGWNSNLVDKILKCFQVMLASAFFDLSIIWKMMTHFQLLYNVCCERAERYASFYK